MSLSLIRFLMVWRSKLYFVLNVSLFELCFDFVKRSVMYYNLIMFAVVAALDLVVCLKLTVFLSFSFSLHDLEFYIKKQISCSYTK